MWFNKGDQRPVYDKEGDDPALLKSKYPPLQTPPHAFARLSKRQKAANELLDIEHIEREVLKCLNETTTRRLYQPSEQVPLATQKQFRSKFVSTFLFDAQLTILPHLSRLKSFSRATRLCSHKR